MPAGDLPLASPGLAGTTAEVYTSATVELPEVVRLFVVYFNKQLKSGNVYEAAASPSQSIHGRRADLLWRPQPGAQSVMPVNESWAEEPTWAADSAIGKPPKSEARFSGEGRSTSRGRFVAATWPRNAAATWLRHPFKAFLMS